MEVLFVRRLCLKSGGGWVLNRMKLSRALKGKTRVFIMGVESTSLVPVCRRALFQEECESSPLSALGVSEACYIVQNTKKSFLSTGYEPMKKQEVPNLVGLVFKTCDE